MTTPIQIESFLRGQRQPLPQGEGKTVYPLYIEEVTSIDLAPFLVSAPDGSSVWVEKVSKEGFLRAAPFDLPQEDEVMALRPMLHAIWEYGVSNDTGNILEVEPNRTSVRKGIRYLKQLGYDELQFVGPALPGGLPPGVRHVEAPFVLEGEGVLMPVETGYVGLFTRVGGRRGALIFYDPTNVMVLISDRSAPFGL